MDQSPRHQKGIPRLVSKLPVSRPSGLPKPTSTIPQPSPAVRPKDSRDAIEGNGVRHIAQSALQVSTPKDELRSGKRVSVAPERNIGLRNSASRDQLRKSANPRPRPAALSSAAEGGGLTPSERSDISPVASPRKIGTRSIIQGESTEIDRELRKKGLTTPRRPSGSFGGPRLAKIQPSGVGDESSIDGSTATETTKPHSLRSQPSLSERTMETLARIPSSPAMTKKPSSFFEGNGRSKSRTGSMSSRPGSSHASEGSRRASFSRPSSRGHDELLPTNRVSSNTFKSRLSTIDGTPGGGSTPIAATKSSPVIRKSASRASLVAGSEVHDMKSPGRKKSYGTLSNTGSKTLSVRSSKPRASVGGMLRKPSLPAMSRAAADDKEPRISHGVWDGAIAPISFNNSLTATESEPSAHLSAGKSSAALRDQIARAKAAKRAERQATAPSKPAAGEQAPIIPSDNGFDFGMEHDDPFNTKKAAHPSKKVLSQRIDVARTSGRLNIAALGLKEMPAEVMNMYDLANMTAQDGSWAETVDLTRLNAADNELEQLDDGIFPDNSLESPEDSESAQHNIFGGLETIDLHGNLLANIPLGFRRLSHLTSLNLSHNRLHNNCIDTIAQMTALRDLKLAKNMLSGPLSSEFSNLTSLEVLDLHGNNISAIPQSIGKMSRLRILNLNENSLEMLPFEALARVPLTELFVKKNKLSGTLIEDPIESLPQLQTLDASLNQLTRLVQLGSAIDLPALLILTLSMNRLQGLPDMTTWTSLLTLTVDGNHISSIPNSFFGLEKLRHADFSGNDIHVVAPEIARMDSLSMMRLSGNPLREKRLASMTTEDLKAHLAARLEPPPSYEMPGVEAPPPTLSGHDKAVEVAIGTHMQAEDDLAESDYEQFATPPTSAPNSPSHSRSQTVSSLQSRSHFLSNQVWPVKQGGVLDRSYSESSSLHPVVCSKVAAEHQVREVQLHHNLFSSIPNSLSFFTSTLSALNMAHNELVGETYLNEEIEFPALKELCLRSNRITGLDPLVKYLKAPMLEKLDISINRLSTLAADLKVAFPRLAILNISNNQVSELSPDTIKGLKVVDASSNEISRLDPRIGLLGGLGGLERLDVMGNRFRVPRWSVLERGTETTLRWLRGRVPVAEMVAWREVNDKDDNFSEVEC